MSPTIKTNGEKMHAFIAMATGGVPREWGDGAIIDAIKQIIEMILPFIMQCFPMRSRFARARFIATAQRMSGFRERQILSLCEAQACRVPGVEQAEEKAVAESAANCVIESLPGMSADELGKLFDEMYSPTEA
jgi:hypothetical protein